MAGLHSAIDDFKSADTKQYKFQGVGYQLSGWSLANAISGT